MPAPALQNPQVEAGTLLRAHARPWQLAHSGCTKAVRTTLYQATWGSNGPVTRCRCAEQPEPRLPPETVPAHVRASPPSPTCTSTFSPEPHPHLQLGGTIVIPPSAGGRSASPAARRRLRVAGCASPPQRAAAQELRSTGRPAEPIARRRGPDGVVSQGPPSAVRGAARSA